MANYVCTNCNSRFNLENSIDCPHCGKNSVKEEKNAEELLDEIEEILES